MKPLILNDYFIKGGRREMVEFSKLTECYDKCIYVPYSALIELVKLYVSESNLEKLYGDSSKNISVHPSSHFNQLNQLISYFGITAIFLLRIDVNSDFISCLMGTEESFTEFALKFPTVAQCIDFSTNVITDSFPELENKFMYYHYMANGQGLRRCANEDGDIYIGKLRQIQYN